MASVGMTVDADDCTPSAIKEIADRIITYASSVILGVMFMLVYKSNLVILGITSPKMYHKNTILYLVLQRIITEEELTKKDLA